MEVFDNFCSDYVGIGKVDAVFEAFVFEPEPSRWEASETDGWAERPTERGKLRSQHVEISVESPAVAAASVTGRASLVLRSKTPERDTIHTHRD